MGGPRSQIVILGLLFAYVGFGCSGNDSSEPQQDTDPSAGIATAINRLNADAFVSDWHGEAIAFPDIGHPNLEPSSPACAQLRGVMEDAGNLLDGSLAKGAFEARPDSAADERRAVVEVLITTFQTQDQAISFRDTLLGAMTSEAVPTCNAAMTPGLITTIEESSGAAIPNHGRLFSTRSVTADGSRETQALWFGWTRGNVAITVLFSAYADLVDNVDFPGLLREVDEATSFLE